MIKDFAHMVSRLGHNAPSLNSSVMARRMRMLICLLLSVLSFCTSYAQATEPSLILASPIKFVDKDKNAQSELEPAIVPEINVTFSTNKLSFGEVEIGKSKSLTFTITNNSNVDVRIGGFGFSGSEISMDWNGGALAVGETKTVTATFTPTRKSSSSSGIMVRVYYGENDDYKMYDFYASGDGVEATEPIEPADPTDPESSGPQLVLWQKDGSKVLFNLSERPQVTMGDDMVKVETVKISAEYDIEDIRKMTYDFSDPDAIKNILFSDKPFSVTDRSIAFIPSETDMNVSIVSANGMVVKELVVSKDEPTAVSLLGMTSGVYLVKVNGVTYKISIR